MAREGGATELVSVNPSGVFGPMLGRDGWRPRPAKVTLLESAHSLVSACAV